MNSVLLIEKALRQELDLYTQVCSLEERKGVAIIAKDGRLLESLSLDQEKLLLRLSAIEERRSGAIEDFRREYRADEPERDITLRDILGSTDGIRSSRLRGLGADLRNLLLKIRALAETNEKLARDNIEFFNLLLAEVKSRVSLKTGYNNRAETNHTIENPLIFSRRA